MTLDVKISSKGIIETLRDQIAELENRERLVWRTLILARCLSISTICWISFT